MITGWARVTILTVLGISATTSAQGVVFIDQMESLQQWKSNGLAQISLDKTNRKTGDASLRVQYIVDKAVPGSAWVARTDVNLDRVPKRWEFFVAVPKDPRLPNAPKFRMALQDRDGTALVADIDSKATQVALPGDFVPVKIDQSDFVPLSGGVNNTLDNVATISFELIPRGGEFMYDGEYELHLDELTAVMHDSNDAIIAWAKRIATRADELQQQLDAIETLGSAKRYPQASLQVIRTFIASAQEENAEGKPVRAARQLRYLDSLCDGLSQQLTDAAAGSHPWPTVPERDYRKMSSKDGNFAADGEVVYPTGFCGWWGPDYFPGYAKLGFTGLTMECGMNATHAEEGKQVVPADVLANIEAAGRNNLAVDMLLSVHYVPQWMYDKYPTLDADELRRKRNPFMPWSIDSADLKTIIGQHIQTLLPAIREFGNLTSYDVTNEMWYAMLGDYAIDDFRSYLASQYKTIAALNAAWGTAFADFADVVCPIDSPTAVADRYQFQEFRLNRFYRWCVDEIHKVDATRPIYSKIHGGWRHVLGVDHTDLSRIFTGNGTDCYPRMNNMRQGLTVNAWDAMMITHQFRSLSPDKVIVDAEHHLIGYHQIVTPQYVRSISWWRSVLGLDADYVWVWGRGIENDMECIFTQPWAVNALGQVSLDRQRLAETIQEFQSYRPDVVLIDAGPRVVDAYTICSYAGVAFDLLPAKALTTQTLDGYRTIVVPPTPRLESDGAFAKSLAEAKSRGMRIIQLSESCAMSELIGSESISKLTPMFTPTPGVVQYTVLQKSGRPMTFLLNLTSEPLTVNAAATTPTLKRQLGRDELQGDRVTLSPLEPMIVAVEPTKK